MSNQILEQSTTSLLTTMLPPDIPSQSEKPAAVPQQDREHAAEETPMIPSLKGEQYEFACGEGI